MIHSALTAAFSTSKQLQFAGVRRNERKCFTATQKLHSPSAAFVFLANLKKGQSDDRCAREHNETTSAMASFHRPRPDAPDSF